MRRWWPSLLAVLVLYILVFHTPFFVTNLLIGTTTKLRSTFRDRHGNLLHYEASHRRLDGNLFAEMIRTGELQPKRIDRATTYPLIAMPKLPKHPTYSSFTTVCAHLVQTYLQDPAQDRRVCKQAGREGSAFGREFDRPRHLRDDARPDNGGGAAAAPRGREAGQAKFKVVHDHRGHGRNASMHLHFQFPPRDGKDRPTRRYGASAGQREARQVPPKRSP